MRVISCDLMQTFLQNDKSFEKPNKPFHNNEFDIELRYSDQAQCYWKMHLQSSSRSTISYEFRRNLFDLFDLRLNISFDDIN